jgi:hypothetical protein
MGGALNNLSQLTNGPGFITQSAVNSAVAGTAGQVAVFSGANSVNSAGPLNLSSGVLESTGGFNALSGGSIKIAGTVAITSARAGAFTSAVIGNATIQNANSGSSVSFGYTGQSGGTYPATTGFQQWSDGEILVGAPTGKRVIFSVASAQQLIVEGTGSTLAGTTTLSALTSSTTRLATINAAGQIGALAYQFDHFRITGSTSISVPGVYSVNASCTITLPTPSASTLGQTYWINSTGSYTVTINPGASIIGYTPTITGIGRQTFQGVQTGASTYAWLCGS